MGSERLQPERIRVVKAASILGVTSRTVQAMALRGELPGAAKIGGLWTFDEVALRKWLQERTMKPSQEFSSRSSAYRSRDVERSAKTCEEALRRLRQLK